MDIYELEQKLDELAVKIEKLKKILSEFSDIKDEYELSLFKRKLLDI